MIRYEHRDTPKTGRKGRPIASLTLTRPNRPRWSSGPGGRIRVKPWHCGPGLTCFGLLVDAAWVHRQNRRWTRRVREGQLRLAVAPEDVDDQVPRGLDRGQFQQLLTGQWILAHQTVLIIGAVGCAKTFLACTAGQAACRQDVRVRYIRLSRLLGELLVARLEHTYPQTFRTWARVEWSA